MNELLSKVNDLVVGELYQANKVNPLFVDENHAWGVIDEELWEAEQSYAKLAVDAVALRNSLCGGSAYRIVMRDLTQVRRRAVHTAAELIQVAAMCDKAEISLED